MDYLLVTNFVLKRNFFHIVLLISVSTHKSGAHVAKGRLFSLDMCIPHSKWLLLFTVQKNIMSQRTISTLKSTTHHVVNGYLFTSQGHILPLQCLQKCYSKACLTSPVSSKMLVISQEHIFPLRKL